MIFKNRQVRYHQDLTEKLQCFIASFSSFVSQIPLYFSIIIYTEFF